MKECTRTTIRKKLGADEQRLKRYSANSRERQRTQEINAAFNTLRRIIPSMPADKMSKIHTLRIATAYIAYLAEMLNEQSDMDFLNCNPQTSFHVWRSTKAQYQLSSTVTSQSLFDSKTFNGRYSLSNNLSLLAEKTFYTNKNIEIKNEWTERSITGIDEYSSSILYNNATTFDDQRAPHLQPQHQSNSCYSQK